MYKKITLLLAIILFVSSEMGLYAQKTKTENTKKSINLLEEKATTASKDRTVTSKMASGNDESLIAVPTLISPENNSTGISNNTQFRWNDIGADSYSIQISTNSSFSVIDGASEDGLPLSLYTPPVEKLKRNTTYFWRVGAKIGASTYWSNTWNFTTLAPGISIDQNLLGFDDTKVNNTSYKTLIISNNGTDVLTISNLVFSSGDVSMFSAITSSNTVLAKSNTTTGVNSVPISVAPGNSYKLTLGFTPTSVGTKSATLDIYHNSNQTGSPISVSLTGKAFASLANIQVANLFDFGTNFFLTSSKDSTLTITNNSTDFLYISSVYFENQDNIFQVLSSFPIYLSAGESSNLKLRFNPSSTGSQITNTLHIINTSLNNPNATVTVRGTVIQSSLIVSPSKVDFGFTSANQPFVIDTIIIQNYDRVPSITINSKTISGDVGSFEFVKNDANVTLIPGQTDSVILKFYPRTSGRKNVTMVINSNYATAPNIYVAITGVGGDNPVITSTPTEVDFGDIQRNSNSETSITLQNDGNLDLYINSLVIIGDNKDDFSYTVTKIPDTLGFGQMKVIKIAVKGNLPAGRKNAQLKIMNNDPNNASYSISLTANVKSSVLDKSSERILFDTTIVSYDRDSILKLKNSGNVTLKVGSIYIDGTYAQDFEFSGVSFPLELTEGMEKNINVKFTPSAVGQRYARMVIKSDDPINPEQTIVLRGVGKDASASVSVSSTSLDFGKVTINESIKKSLCILNNSKEVSLRIDSIYLEEVSGQPFSFTSAAFPLTIEIGGSLCFDVKFNPLSNKRSYSVYLHILTSDQNNKDIAVELTGTAAIPSISTNLEEYVDFGKIAVDSSKTNQIKIYNSGDSYLLIDSIRILKTNASEFALASRVYPIRVDPDETDNIYLTFFPKTVGVKDAKLKIYTNDPNYTAEIKISAEGVTKSSQILEVETAEIPDSYGLSQNYPNPFNPSTVIGYQLPVGGYVSLKIYNTMGQEIQTLVNGYKQAGVFSIEWHPESIKGGLPSGLYFYVMQMEKFKEVKKILYVR
jgi:hypothetical protein